MREQNKNWLAKQTGQKRLDNLMIIRKEVPSVEDFNPDHAINAWHGEKMQRVGGETSHKYPAKEGKNKHRNNQFELLYLI